MGRHLDGDSEQRDHADNVHTPPGNRQTVAGARLVVVAKGLASGDHVGLARLVVEEEANITAEVLVPHGGHDSPRNDGEGDVQDTKNDQEGLQGLANEAETAEEAASERDNDRDNVEGLARLEELLGLAAGHVVGAHVVLVLVAIVLETPHRHTVRYAGTTLVDTLTLELGDGSTGNEEHEGNEHAEREDRDVHLTLEVFEGHF